MNRNAPQEVLTLYQKFYSSTQAAQWSVYYEPNIAVEAPRVYASTWNEVMTPYTWHSLKITFQPSGVTTACLDGTTVCRSTNSPPFYGWTDNWRLTIGHFDGDLDEVRISNALRP